MKVIVTGTTGMVGKGVLLKCLRNDAVESRILNCRTAEHQQINFQLRRNKSVSGRNCIRGLTRCFDELCGVSIFSFSNLQLRRTSRFFLYYIKLTEKSDTDYQSDPLKIIKMRLFSVVAR